MLENTLPKDLVKMTDLQFYLSHGLTPFWCEKAFLCLLTGGKIDAESVLGNIATFNLEDQKLVFGACKSWPGSSFCQQNYSAENLCEGCFDFPFIIGFWELFITVACTQNRSAKEIKAKCWNVHICEQYNIFSVIYALTEFLLKCHPGVLFISPYISP